MALRASALCSIPILLFLFSPSFATSPDPASIFNSESVCKLTPHADFCKSILPSNKFATILDFGRDSMHQSLLNAHSFLGSIKYFLRQPSTSYLGTIRALQDCQFLAETNVDFLSYTSERIKFDRVDTFVADDLHCLLSAVLTNVQTCVEGLEAMPLASSVKHDLLPSMSNGTNFLSVSLALFRHGWVHGFINSLLGRNHVVSNLVHGRDSPLPLIMLGQDREVYESASRRKDVRADGKGEGVSVSHVVVVNPDGNGNFTTINEAVAAAPNNTGDSNQHFLIYVAAGIYEEYVSIPKKKQNLMMIGAGINKTIITGNHNFVDGSTTFNSATFAVVGKGFVAVDITFRNTAGPSKHQAVAVRNGADMSTFYRCSFEGYQDTLYAHSLRQFYKECDIYGTIDFIFGNAAVVLQNCNIYPRLPMPNQFNTITAQGRTDPNQNTGISIHKCVIKPAADLSSSDGKTKTYLGRPWKEYSRTVYMQSFMDSLIEPSGWSEWAGNFALDTLYYAEYDNKGPGSNTTSRVQWGGYHKDISESESDGFTVSKFIDGEDWLPATGVPFHGGLF
ncbi:putative pectinesterase/pectinesterase inhibitor 20 [Hibiscus syriacus]|uniref:Pectinesterase n=1 Tax=Hibiscus syriacus TaxID=106335 RepID=A0A6A2YIM6_HIBSY|nr:pectinesterase-like [Hibiscus syriacus]KAE8675414.1 putative pectinesterase/pectinesterase inhibitor 20 [Hibiscus syriacus]